MSQSERTHARERKRVDEDLQRSLDQFGDGGEPRGEAACGRRAADAERSRCCSGSGKRAGSHYADEQRDVDDREPDLAAEPSAQLAAPVGFDRVQQQSHGEQDRAAIERDEQDRQRIGERLEPERPNHALEG